jgi:hypothetical protein
MLVCVKVETRDTRQSVGSVQEQSQTRTRPRTNVATAVGDKEIERNAQDMVGTTRYERRLWRDKRRCFVMTSVWSDL